MIYCASFYLFQIFFVLYYYRTDVCVFWGATTMSKRKNETINVKGTLISIAHINQNDYISLTDLAKYRNSKDPSQVISLWMRTYSTIEYLGLWETLYNQDFKPTYMRGLKLNRPNQASGFHHSNGSEKPALLVSSQNQGAMVVAPLLTLTLLSSLRHGCRQNSNCISSKNTNVLNPKSSNGSPLNGTSLALSPR